MFRSIPIKVVFEEYLLSLGQDRDDKTEHSDRGALETLLTKAAEEAGPGIRIIHEAKKVRGSGAPDFKVMKAAMILGYVENKTVGENLDQILKSEQIARYKALSTNILLTDYLQFIWIKDGKVNRREIIAFPKDLEGKPKMPHVDRVKAVSDLLRGFFSTAPEGIGRSRQLALALATRSHFLRDFLDSQLRREGKEHTERRLYGLYQNFRDQVFHELALGEFADAFAQMLAYGLFLAKLNSNGDTITLANARQFITAVYINKTQSFAPVPVEVWDFHIGGYKVIDKYLKSRKGRAHALTLNEIENVEKVVNVLAFTIEQMEKIDTSYRAQV